MKRLSFMKLLVSCYWLGGKKVDVGDLVENKGFSGLKEKGEGHDS